MGGADAANQVDVTCTAHCSEQRPEDQVRHHELLRLAEEEPTEGWRQDGETEPLHRWRRHKHLEVTQVQAPRTLLFIFYLPTEKQEATS